MQRIHVYYSGRVQGVGFRATASIIAKNMGIKGWVKNLPNEKVELVAEAEKQILEEFIKKIDSSSIGKYITNKDISQMEASGEFNEFKIIFF